MPERDWLDDFSTSVVLVLAGAVLGWAFNLLPLLSNAPLLVAIFAAIVFFFPRPKLYLVPARLIRRWMRRRSFKNPRIGVLNGYIKSETDETCCQPGYTSFTPEDWRDNFQRRSNADRTYTVELIPASKIGRRYAVIVNPFGELYPEADLIELKTFKSIKEFVRAGGIFVHAGGVPFYYSWDARSGRPRPTSRDLQFSSFTAVQPGQPTVISPAYARGRVPSLVDTLSRDHFQLRTTADDNNMNLVPAYQTGAERRFVGDIERAGGTDKVEEFRAVADETPQFIPFLRCKTPNFGEVYPLGAIPYGEGFLAVAGMNFQTAATDGTVRVAEAQLEKVCSAVANMTERLCRRQWPS